jgi:dihydroorotate dehydrogenase
MGNTTLDRMRSKATSFAGEAGGLSGQPLYGPNDRALLGRPAQKLDDNIPIIGVGGITSGADANARSRRRKLVQFYSGMVFRGPELVGECVSSIRAPSRGRAVSGGYQLAGKRLARKAATRSACRRARPSWPTSTAPMRWRNCSTSRCCAKAR